MKRSKSIQWNQVTGPLSTCIYRGCQEFSQTGKNWKKNSQRNGVQGVGGSNPLVPTMISQEFLEVANLRVVSLFVLAGGLCQFCVNAQVVDHRHGFFKLGLG